MWLKWTCDFTVHLITICSWQCKNNSFYTRSRLGFNKHSFQKGRRVNKKYCYDDNPFLVLNKGPFKYYVIKEVGGVRKWLFLMIYNTLKYQRVGWVGLKKSKTWWRNTWMVPNNDFEIMATEIFFCKIIFNNAMKNFSLKASK